MRFIEIGDDYLTAEMPVDKRTVQPFRLLHGGASVALAETLGSVAGFLVLNEPDTHIVVGVDINATHLRSVREGGKVRGTVRPVRVGNTVQVWQIDIVDERGRAVCSSRLSCQVVRRR
jgi:1,4-dihydroxy-2-naphthoyl-CoA hydrolase